MAYIPDWLPVTTSLVGTAIALSAFGYQVWRARFKQSVDLLFKLEADFFGPAKKAQRAKAATNIEKGQFEEAEPILDFFETIGLLVRRGALDKEMVWHTFFYWIDHYFEASYEYIESRQRIDPVVWKDLVALTATMQNIQRRALKVVRLPRRTPEDRTAFLAQEKREVT